MSDYMELLKFPIFVYETVICFATTPFSKFKLQVI